MLSVLTKNPPVFNLNYILTSRSTWCNKFLSILRNSTISCCLSAFPPSVLRVSFPRSAKFTTTCLSAFWFPEVCYFPVLFPFPYEIKNKTSVVLVGFPEGAEANARVHFATFNLKIP